MGKKTNHIFTICLIFALIMFCWGILSLTKNSNYVTCSKLYLGDFMDIVNDSRLNDYNQLVEELNLKYFEKVCDVFDMAKKRLTNSLNAILGSEYADLNEEIKSLKKAALAKRQSADNEEYSVNLRERLETCKANFVEAKEDNDRAEKKQALNAVLSEIASRNLKIFTEMANLRKEIDQKRLRLIEIVKSKENEYKNVEKKIISDARKQSLEIAVSYRSEISALSYAFDVNDYSKDMPFISMFDPDMRLMEFDKQSFMDAFTGKQQSCGIGCSGNCKSCAGNKNYFTAIDKDGTKN